MIIGSLEINTRYEYTTLDLEIFIVKVFLRLASTRKKEVMDNHYGQHISYTAQLANYITQDGLGSTHG